MFMRGFGKLITQEIWQDTEYEYDTDYDKSKDYVE